MQGLPLAPGLKGGLLAGYTGLRSGNVTTPGNWAEEVASGHYQVGVLPEPRWFRRSGLGLRVGVDLRKN